MKRTLFFAIAYILMMTTNLFSQEIIVRFTGKINVTDYCRLDRVVVTNLTRNWSETVEYPDTIVVLGSTVGANLNTIVEQGLGQNTPNPFDCETRVELAVPQREEISMQLLDVAGKVYAEYNGMLDAGTHIFDISASNPQTYLLNAIVGSRSYSIRMVNVGSGCGSCIKYVGSSNGIESKMTSTNEFQIGDNMRYVGYATIDGESVVSAVVERRQFENQNISLHFSLTPTTGTINGHEWVDLGLPSGTRWATCNVGGTKSHEYGEYFAWGETATKENYNWSTYIYCNGSYNALTKYCHNAEYGADGFTDNLTVLESSDDAATANWGAGWQMPTYDQMLELYNNCIHEWTTVGGVNGQKFTGRNGNSIFLPAAGSYDINGLILTGTSGVYCTKSLSTFLLESGIFALLDRPDASIVLDFCSFNIQFVSHYRWGGYTVRAVVAQ